MKITYFSLAVFSVIVFLAIGSQQAHADNVNGVYIQNIQVQPSTIKVGDTFTITTTLVNNSTVPIVLGGDKCSIKDTVVPFFTVSFDYHAKIKANNIICAGVGWSQILDPGKSITGTSPDYTFNYVATESGTATVTVTFSYDIRNQTDLTLPPLVQTISKSLLFTVLNNNTGIKKITDTVLPPLQQLRSGVAPADIVCKENLTLIFKKDGGPACVRPQTAEKLIERGWTKTPKVGVPAGSPPAISILNVAVSPQPIVLGDPFSVNATVVNNYSVPITYYDACSYPLSVELDKSVQTYPYYTVHCLAISKIVLAPKEKATVQSDKIGTVYNATGPTSVRANIGFSYEIDGKSASFYTVTEFQTVPKTIGTPMPGPNATGNGTMVVLREGQREGPLLVQKILPDNVQGLNFREYPLATNVGYPVTLHIGESASNGCTVILTLVKINGDTATFLENEYNNRPCPICLSENTVIDTPNGTVNVTKLQTGMSVFTQDSSGHKITTTISQTGKTLAPPGHKMVHLVLDDKRELYVSPNHPTADGRFFGELSIGDTIDGSKIVGLEEVPYNGTYTYDILPSGPTGFYWANGILVKSTLR